MEQSTITEGSDDEFLPDKRLEAPNYRLVEASIATIPNMETPRECVVYENAYQNRTQILRRLKWKAEDRVKTRGRIRPRSYAETRKEVVCLYPAPNSRT